MHNFLPKISKFIFVFLLFFIFITQPAKIFAESASTATPEPEFQRDQEVTFVGKTAARANEFLQWTLSEKNYKWIYLPDGGGQDPIQAFWVQVRNIVFALLALFVLGAAFVMIITRGQNLTVMKFIPQFIMIVVLIYFSYATIRFLYQSTDVVQGFFLSVPKVDNPTQNKYIGPEDLLYIAFDYKSFTGYRIPGIDFDESAFVSLLLVKLTAITYYVMTGILLIRKIILWFFLIVSPVFPILIFFRPVRNTAKIWVGEFFRWLLYAPLFAIFLHGLVMVWRSPNTIPMYFHDFKGVGATQTYPTAISILIGGPGQKIDMSNSVNLSDTFALYVVALLMLWVVILLPFLLLQIFLDYLGGVSLSENSVVRRITSNTWFKPSSGGPPPGSTGEAKVAPSPFGMARNLPFFNKRQMEIPTARTATTLERASLSNLQTVRETKDVLRLANLSIPKMRDIARYETSMTRHDVASRSEVNRFHETLEKISKPMTAGIPNDREKFTTIKEKLVTQQKQGDKLADNVLNASKVSEEVNKKTKAVIPGQRQEAAQGIKDVKLPQTNQVQQVSIEEYEDVKKMWQENYQNMETPIGQNGIPTDKHTFLQQDIQNITETINLLSSENQENVDKGMDRVANILPFLLLGGFSKTEVISYLKAKLEAAKSVLTSVDSKKDEEDTMVERSEGTTEGHGEMSMKQELPNEEDAKDIQPNNTNVNEQENKDENGGNSNPGVSN